jgi:hypothetical protein
MFALKETDPLDPPLALDMGHFSLEIKPSHIGRQRFQTLLLARPERVVKPLQDHLALGP